MGENLFCLIANSKFVLTVPAALPVGSAYQRWGIILKKATLYRAAFFNFFILTHHKSSSLSSVLHK